PHRLFILLALLCSTLPLFAAPQVSLAQETEPATTELTTPEMVERVLPGVVQIMAYTPDEDGSADFYGIGSGFVLDAEGHIITNWHVVTGQEVFYVTYTNGTYVEAELIGLDARDDIAVLKVDPETVPAVLPLGDSDAVLPGEKVVAIGSPSGITNTITEGVATGSGRTGAEPGLYLQSQCGNYNNMVQHSAAINNGNSGGPLFNMRGEVIGINTISILDESGADLAGIYFAVPSNTIAKRAADMIDDGELSLPVIGIQSIPITIPDAILNDLPFAAGVLVTEVATDSPAERAGLEENMIILAIDDRDITKDDTLSEILFNYDPGDTITITYLDPGGDGEQTVDLRLAELEQETIESCEEVPEE
ncbi:MAG: trypsin-like peptidase domain-containing protein, partial [Thermomicrobiales bacterium]